MQMPVVVSNIVAAIIGNQPLEKYVQTMKSVMADKLSADHSEALHKTTATFQQQVELKRASSTHPAAPPSSGTPHTPAPPRRTP